MLRFGPSGIPLSTRRAGTEHGIRRIRELGLDLMEMAWGNGVRMRDETADRIARARAETGIELTVHAPYYVNLCGSEEIVGRSVRRLVDTARQAARCGARSACFHAGFYQGQPADEAARCVGERLGEVAGAVRAEGLPIELRPELTGRASQLGSFDEILAWSRDIDGIQPCLDFAHQYARLQGRCNGYDDFATMLARVQATLGPEALGRVHVHVSGIEYGPAGERRHLPLLKSRFRWRELLRALKDAGASGWVVCETPAMEEDALRMKRSYRRMK